MLTNLLVVFLFTAGTFSLAPQWMQPSMDGHSGNSPGAKAGVLQPESAKSDKQAQSPAPGAGDGKESVKSARLQTVAQSSNSGENQPVDLKPGAAPGSTQEYTPSSGPSESPPPPDSAAVAETIKDLKNQPDLVRVLRARLKGSLCPSCLIRLERKLKDEDGVKYARVIRPAKNGGAVVYEPSYAQVEVIYLVERWNVKKLKKFIERNDFGIRDEKDLRMTSDYRPILDPI
jgi:hypothetical protein